jgi:hypothetical protein
MNIIGTRQQSSTRSGDRRSLSAVRVRVGILDRPAARELRMVLRDLAVRPRTKIVVDVSELDDRHELTLFTCVREAGRRIRDPLSRLVVVQPPDRLTRYLASTCTEVSTGPEFPYESPCDLRMDFGAVNGSSCHAIVLSGQAEDSRVVVCPFAASCVGMSLSPSIP